jgi:hypothetical protein
MCDLCNSNETVSDDVKNEIENLSDSALQEITRIVAETLQAQSDLMVAGVMRALDVEEVTLNAEIAGDLKFALSTGRLKLDGNASADNETFTFKLVESEISDDDGLLGLMQALGLV